MFTEQQRQQRYEREWKQAIPEVKGREGRNDQTSGRRNRRDYMKREVKRTRSEVKPNEDDYLRLMSGRGRDMGLKHSSPKIPISSPPFRNLTLIKVLTLQGTRYPVGSGHTTHTPKGVKVPSTSTQQKHLLVGACALI